jgi:hypothetical protein
MSVLSDKAISDQPMTSDSVGRANKREASDFLGGGLRGFDALLRRWMGIRQFCSDRHCIFRIALVPAKTDIRLADGTTIQAGDTIGELHLWNEHLPRITASDPGIAWGLVMRRQFDRSLQRLAIHIDQNPEFSTIDAFRGSIAFAGRLGRSEQVKRIADWYGFELVLRQHTFSSRLHEIIDSLFACCLIRAFNPAGLRNSWLTRQRHEIWMSRGVLIKRHGRYRLDGAGPRCGND